MWCHLKTDLAYMSVHKHLNFKMLFLQLSTFAEKKRLALYYKHLLGDFCLAIGINLEDIFIYINIPIVSSKQSLIEDHSDKLFNNRLKCTAMLHWSLRKADHNSLQITEVPSKLKIVSKDKLISPYMILRKMNLYCVYTLLAIWISMQKNYILSGNW